REVLEAKGLHALTELCAAFPDTMLHGIIVLEPTVTQKADVLRRLIAAHQETAQWIAEARPQVLAFIQQQWNVPADRAASALHTMRECFVATLDSAAFATVIQASAQLVGKPPMPVES